MVAPLYPQKQNRNIGKNIQKNAPFNAYNTSEIVKNVISIIDNHFTTRALEYTINFKSIKNGAKVEIILHTKNVS